MSTKISIKELPSRNPDPSTAKAHHVGSPPSAFINPWPSYAQPSGGTWEILKMRFGSHPERNFIPVPEGANGARSDQLVKVLKPTWGVDQRDKLRATWIGHASWLVETPVAKGAERGVRILFDPVFSERTSPSNYFGPKRYTPTPCTLDELPDPDIVVISHNHYDHLDIETVKPLYDRTKNRIHFFVPLGLKQWFLEHVGCSDHEVTQLDWWESREAHIEGLGSVELTCCPAQHTSRRTAFDSAKTLWSSWSLKTTTKTLYFAGDTAYQLLGTPSPCPAFSQIGKTLGPFDLAMLPIGLYSPMKFASAVHVHPEQALEIHKAVRSKLSLGMHYGTVRGGLSAVFEPVTDPPRRWREAAEKEGIWCGGGVEGDGTHVDFKKGGAGLCHVGETVAV
ncbi:hypothetical protein PRZ48_007701 [Zasmidium cellare]|uniref:Metallo-beta-lactamase domain-containing protein n=1 Tax=Zasmidium cellare TaxID=395010 RepID=A0ABR0EK70_ZASCE|nr:hypothetical protein PRZ48_007701 [Zasmidium cellare]